LGNNRKNAIDKIMDVTTAILNNSVFILFLVMILSSFLQVICRRIFNASLTWSEELARYCTIWMVMFTTAIAFKNRNHIGIDFFLAKLPPKGRRILEDINDIIVILVMGYFTYYSAALLLGGRSTPSPAMRIPMGFVYAGVVVGGFFSVVFALYAFAKRVQGYSREKAAPAAQ
jgi:TRAP-type C4-dicarboxylate transport system permease small subunit